ncbi:phosphatidylinositol 3,4,5-trisphosphate 3-phosphatase TPTE2-like isoform X3 [Trachypithecus francoisi]|uniref:phosphatidylinositol 3,4,5-trisphosphate 3-phosphatase TPTE2-like isoform X3 n=1 Tax=Trachypithecus francoisi TaxID=54180 RepID=UPI00141B41CE|nr:phosphatidylinositol 3,4,5-trisphosphate 3-phosphatase TPTE2-like isoform X3 [Trachypithecus francoisi]
MNSLNISECVFIPRMFLELTSLLGRTGTVVCAFLITSELFLTAKESLYYFGERRTDKTNSTEFQGVEIPSQNRYVGYFAQVNHIYNWNLPPRRILFTKAFIIYSIHGIS